ncbi:hypothetical protein [Nioella nitratireducens]|uniref:hypothetical protein n=1 Tax=Nioella nitratireducens TaxID=1287720 RepID=UPI001314A267|nr:hypothetical protein [Nioella nitratireducens]
MTRLLFATDPAARHARKGGHSSEIRSHDARRADCVADAPCARVTRARLSNFRRAIHG